MIKKKELIELLKFTKDNKEIVFIHDDVYVSDSIKGASVDQETGNIIINLTGNKFKQHDNGM